MTFTQNQTRALEKLAKMDGPVTTAAFPRGFTQTLAALADRGLVHINVTISRRGMLAMDARAHARNLADQHRRRAAKRPRADAV